MANAGEMRVLLATDGSRDALTAGDWLRHLPLPPSARVLVVSVATLPLPADLPTAPEVYDSLREAARRATADAAAGLAGRLPRVDTRVLEGDPRGSLVAVAREWSADLIVVGARGLGAVQRFLLGSVSTALLHHAPCSVLVARGAPGVLRRILVAIDASPSSLAALRFLLSLPLEPSVTVRLLAVVESPRFPAVAAEQPVASAVELLAAWTAERRRELEDTLARLASEIGARVGTVERSVVEGPPAQAIIDAASEPGVDLVVVGARGLGPVERLLIGSVSDRVAHHVSRPILVVRSRRAT
jgi:nucleotide-binding universal stress UspA family protein